MTFQMHLCKSCRLPFDWKTPPGYLVAIAIQYTMISYAAIIGSSVTTFGIGTYLYVIASCECIKENLLSMRMTNGNDANGESVEQLIEFIQFHSLVKQLRRK